MKIIEISGIFLREKAPPHTQGWWLPWDHPWPQRMVLEEHVAFPEVTFGVRLLIMQGCAGGWRSCGGCSDPGKVVQHPGSHKLEKRGLKILWKLALGQLLFQPQFLGMGFVLKDMSLQLNGIKVYPATVEGWPEIMLLLKASIILG